MTSPTHLKNFMLLSVSFPNASALTTIRNSLDPELSLSFTNTTYSAPFRGRLQKRKTKPVFLNLIGNTCSVCAVPGLPAISYPLSSGGGPLNGPLRLQTIFPSPLTIRLPHHFTSFTIKNLTYAIFSLFSLSAILHGIVMAPNNAKICIPKPSVQFWWVVTKNLMHISSFIPAHNALSSPIVLK